MRWVPARAALVLFCLSLYCYSAMAQPPVKSYSIKKGKMQITLGKNISLPSLDSFVAQYDLGDMHLQRFFETGKTDSLLKIGWRIELNNNDLFIISKPIEGFDNIDDPANKIIFTEKRGKSEPVFPSVSSSVLYGYNRFRNKGPFRIEDSLITFFLRDYHTAKKVILSGSFSNWSHTAIPMEKTDSGWTVRLKLTPGKYWYKFIVDGNWIFDRDNVVNENDGQGNINSVYFRPNYRVELDSFITAKHVYLAGSFNDWKPRDLEMNKTSKGWAVDIYLANGTHTYRYVVDGKWMADPFNSDRLPNEFNDFNSVIKVGKPYIFRLDGYTSNKQVVLSGSFNKWRRDELFMKKTETGWELPYSLGPGNYEYNFVVDGKWVAQSTTSGKPGNMVFVIDPNYTFRLKGFSDAKNIFLAGDFNNWSPNGFAMQREGNEWVLKMHLYPGKHLYKFVVDGKWIIDPGNNTWEQNEHNSGNSVIWIEPNE